MAERQNTLTYSFDPKSPRVSAFEIHEWIHGQLRIPEHEVQMLQIDGPRRQVLIKMKQCNELIRIALAQYGDIKSIQEKSWSKAYRYAVSNGIKIVTMALKTHSSTHNNSQP